MGRRGLRLTEKQHAEICLGYLSGQTSTQLSEKYGITPPGVFVILKRNRIPLRTASESHRTYKIKEKYFDTINTQNKAYILGFLFADGSNNEQKGEAKLEVLEKDLEIVKKINDQIQPEKPLRFYQVKTNFSKGTTRTVRLSLENKHVSQTLASLGVVQNKTYKTRFPNIDKKLVRHFIRGVFDGDGCISVNKKNLKESHFSIIGYFKFIEEVQKYLALGCALNMTKLSLYWKNPKIATVAYGGRLQLKRIRHYLYDGATLFMKRKKDRFEFLRRKVGA